MDMDLDIDLFDTLIDAIIRTDRNEITYLKCTYDSSNNERDGKRDG